MKKYAIIIVQSNSQFEQIQRKRDVLKVFVQKMHAFIHKSQISHIVVGWKIHILLDYPNPKQVVHILLWKLQKVYTKYQYIAMHRYCQNICCTQYLITLEWHSIRQIINF